MNNELSVSLVKKNTIDAGTHVGFSAFQKMIYMFFCVVLLVTCNSVYWVSVNTRNSQVITLILFLLLIVISLNSIVSTIHKRINLAPFVYFIFLWLIMVIPFVLMNVASGFFHVRQGLLFIFFPLLAALFINSLLQEGNLLDFVSLMVKAIVAIACLSLVMWVIALIGNRWTGSTMIDWGQIRYTPSLLGIQFQTQSVNLANMTLLRNTSFFAEAPMYSFVLTIGLLLKLFVVDKRVKVDSQNIIFVITILSTFSSTGIIVGTIAYAASYVVDKGNKALLFFVLAVPVVAFFVYWILRTKSQNDTYDSVSTRLEDLQVGFNAWRSKPLFGDGLDNSDALISRMSYSRTMLGGNSGFSSGLFNILAGGGIYQFAFSFLIPLIRVIWSKNNQNILFFLFFMVLMVFTMSDSSFLFFFIVTLAYFLPVAYTG
ncbi:O-antigen ligase family protein [Oenococcus sp.]|uniref:O-antigen ligase family protein n=1 Tax=Oenococcus sp. TaxID=1979414 RepID=UPI0039EB611C